MRCATKLLLLFCLCVMFHGCSDRPRPEILGKIESAVRSGEIAQVEVFFMRYETLTRATMTPEMLVTQAEFRQKENLSDGLRTSFLNAIKQAEIEPLDDSADLRWGLLLQDSNGVVLHSIFLNSRYITGTGRRGYIDGVAYSFNAALISWCEDNFFRNCTSWLNLIWNSCYADGELEEGGTVLIR